MRIALLIFALTITQALAIEMLPSERMCTAVFKGEVVSVQMVQGLTNRSATAELYLARIKVTSVTKQDIKLGHEVTVYYMEDASQVCPRCVVLTPGLKGKFYSKRVDIADKKRVLYIPMALWVESDK